VANRPKLEVRVTRRAVNDLKTIARYTEQTWGKGQRNRYLKKFEERFKWLAENPKAGRHRLDLAEGYFSFPEGQHVVFYLITATSIDVIGVVHQEMDPDHYFIDR